MPAPVADMGGPPYSSRIENASTESTFSSHGEAGPSYPPCQHRARPQSIPCGHCAKINHHRALRQTVSLTDGFDSPACEHRGAGFFLPGNDCQEEKYDQYVRCRLLAENAAPLPTDHFAAYEAEVEKAEREKRIFQRRPTPITWCIRCKQEHCKEDCGSPCFNKEEAALRGDTPIATLAKEGYSSSETVRPREILYSPALVQKIETRNKAIQTRKSRTRNRATQTEAQAIPLNAPLFANRLTYLILLLVTASIVLAGLAAIPGAHARLLTATEHLPSSAPGLLRAAISLSLVIIASKFLFVKAAAAVTTIPDLLEPTAAAATVFMAALAAGYLLVRKPRPDTDESIEVIDETSRANEKWIPFLQDISAPEFTEWKTGLINERHSKNALRSAIFALFARLQASLDLGQRQKEFIDFLNNNPPREDLLARLRAAANIDNNEGAINRIEKWGKHIDYEHRHFWPLFPDEEKGDLARMASRTRKGKQLWEIIAKAAAGYTLAHGLPLDPENVLHLQEWINAAPREFEKDVAMMFTPRPITRTAILERIRELVKQENDGCTHNQELAKEMQNDEAMAWDESIRGINNLMALTSIVTRRWGTVLSHFALLVKPGKDIEDLEKDNAALREELDDALIRLELRKGTNGGGPQKYTVPLFDTCFTDVCS